MQAYIPAEKPTHQTTTLKTVWLMLNRKIRSPEKNRKSERCSRVGRTPTASGR
jgi:hypothetical protein